MLKRMREGNKRNPLVYFHMPRVLLTEPKYFNKLMKHLMLKYLNWSFTVLKSNSCPANCLVKSYHIFEMLSINSLETPHWVNINQISPYYIKHPWILYSGFKKDLGCRKRAGPEFSVDTFDTRKCYQNMFSWHGLNLSVTPPKNSTVPCYLNLFHALAGTFGNLCKLVIAFRWCIFCNHPFSQNINVKAKSGSLRLHPAVIASGPPAHSELIIPPSICLKIIFVSLTR